MKNPHWQVQTYSVRRCRAFRNCGMYDELFSPSFSFIFSPHTSFILHLSKPWHPTLYPIIISLGLAHAFRPSLSLSSSLLNFFLGQTSFFFLTGTFQFFLSLLVRTGALQHYFSFLESNWYCALWVNRPPLSITFSPCDLPLLPSTPLSLISTFSSNNEAHSLHSLLLF